MAEQEDALAAAKSECEALRRQVHRLQHGEEIESDRICEHELRATEAERERDEAVTRLGEHTRLLDSLDSLDTSLRAIVAHMPTGDVVNVREDGGDEDVAATLAVSVQKLMRRASLLESQLAAVAAVTAAARKLIFAERDLAGVAGVPTEEPDAARACAEAYEALDAALSDPAAAALAHDEATRRAALVDSIAAIERLIRLWHAPENYIGTATQSKNDRDVLRKAIYQIYALVPHEAQGDVVDAVDRALAGKAGR